VKYSALCLYERCQLQPFYASCDETVARGLAEFGYPHYTTVMNGQKSLSFSQFLLHMRSCTSLHVRLVTCMRENMGHRKKVSKNTFFEGLGYDLKYYENFMRRRGNNPKPETKDNNSMDSQPDSLKLVSDSDGSTGENGTSAQSCDHTMQCIERLMTVCQVTTIDGTVCTNEWRTGRLQDFHCQNNMTDEMLSEGVTDVIFNTAAARKTFSTFCGRSVPRTDDTSLMLLVRADAWMTSILEDTLRKLRGVGKRGREPFVLRNRFHALLPTAVQNLQG